MYLVFIQTSAVLPCDMAASDEENDGSSDSEDFGEESSENDETFIEQEFFERETVNEYKLELDNLKNEADIPLEEVLKGYDLNHEENDQSSFNESDSSSTCSESSSSRESSSDSLESISSVCSGSLVGLNQLLIPNGPNEEQNKFRFSVIHLHCFSDHALTNHCI